MKKKKVFVTLGAIVLMLGLVMNVQYALADYSIETNSLPIMEYPIGGTLQMLNYSYIKL